MKQSVWVIESGPHDSRGVDAVTASPEAAEAWIRGSFRVSLREAADVSLSPLTKVDEDYYKLILNVEARGVCIHLTTYSITRHELYELAAPASESTPTREATA